jgi:hypothetical protein
MNVDAEAPQTGPKTTNSRTNDSPNELTHFLPLEIYADAPSC